jgi:hypothetical protein
MTKCKFCGEELKESKGLFKCTNKGGRCPMAMLSKGVTLGEHTKLADEAKHEASVGRKCQNCKKKAVNVNHGHPGEFLCYNCGWAYHEINGKLVAKTKMNVTTTRKAKGMFRAPKDLVKEAHLGYKAVKQSGYSDEELLEIADNYSYYKETNPDRVREIETIAEVTGVPAHRMWAYVRYRIAVRKKRKLLGIEQAKEQVIKRSVGERKKRDEEQNKGKGQLGGRVTGDKEGDENGVAGAGVVVRGPITKKVKTRPDGTYVSMNLPPGIYKVVAGAVGYVAAIAVVDIKPGKATLKDFQLKSKKGKEEKKEKHWRDYYSTFNIMDILPVILLAGAGFALAVAFGNQWFIWGFLSWIIVYLIPNPEEFAEPEGWNMKKEQAEEYFKRKGSGWGNMWKEGFSPMAPGGGLYGVGKHGPKGRHHVRGGWLRALFKVTAIITISFGFYYSPFPLANLAVLFTLFIGYYNLGIEWSAPHEYMESLGRFVLGFVLIPFAFILIFQSFLLGFIALAFFAIPPIRKKPPEAEYEYSELPLKLIFMIIMGGVLIASGSLGFLPLVGDSFAAIGWELGKTSVLGPLFIYFWLITFIAGTFSPASARPYAGFVMLGAATLIFALGPGVQDVGSGLFGQWFPTIHNAVTEATEPLGDIFGGLGSTIQNAILLITCPTCYAQGIINGTYAEDPVTGLKGAYGVGIEEFRTTPLYSNQSYLAIIKVENKGSAVAKGVRVSILHGPKTPGSITQSFNDMKSEFGFYSSDKDGVPGDDIVCTSKECWQYLDYDEGNELPKLDVRQVFFDSVGISCLDVNKFKLKEKFIPLEARVSYDYEIDSTMQVEVMSQEEWDRLVKEKGLDIQKKKAATFTNAPVRLNIDTFEQPIREGSPLFVNLQLASAKGGNSTIDEVYEISVEIPKKFVGASPSCSPSGLIATNKDPVLFEWDKNAFKSMGGNYVIYCDLGKAAKPSGPTETFVIKARSSYRYTDVEDTETRLEFGGLRCCESKSDCPGALECGDDGICWESAIAGEYQAILDKLSEDLEELKELTEETIKQAIQSKIDEYVQLWGEINAVINKHGEKDYLLVTREKIEIRADYFRSVMTYFDAKHEEDPEKKNQTIEDGLAWLLETIEHYEEQEIVKDNPELGNEVTYLLYYMVDELESLKTS